MVATTVKQFLPILGMVLVLVIVSMMIVSFFNINLAETRGLRTLNQAVVYEGFSELLNDDEEEEKEGFTEANNHKKDIIDKK